MGCTTKQAVIFIKRHQITDKIIGGLRYLAGYYADKTGFKSLLLKFFLLSFQSVGMSQQVLLTQVIKS